MGDLKIMFNKIIDNLYIGDAQDSVLFDKEFPTGVILCVLEQRPSIEPDNAFHVPIKTDSGHVHTEQLDKVSTFIDAMLKTDRKILVHCMAGIERSPLAVAYFLSHYFGMTIEQAYQLVKKGRPQTQDRRVWLR